jgi:hypothetical protein
MVDPSLNALRIRDIAEPPKVLQALFYSCARASTSRRGSAFRIIDLAPGCATPARRGPSIDYCMSLSGEAELMLGDGKGAALSAGDTAVLRGTRQAWRNPSPDTPCRIVVCTI